MMLPWGFTTILMVTTMCLFIRAHSQQTDDNDGMLRSRMDELEAIVKQQQRIIDGLTATLDDNSAEISDLKNRVTALEVKETNEAQTTSSEQERRGIVRRAPDIHIAFFARMDIGQVDNIAAGEHIVFEVAILNIGGCYQAHTGVFTASINGVYQFSASVSSRRSSYPYEVLAEVVHNGYTIGKAFTQGDDHWLKDQGAITVVIQLVAGDKVWVRSAEYDQATVFGSGFSSFTGFLLWSK